MYSCEHTHIYTIVRKKFVWVFVEKKASHYYRGVNSSSINYSKHNKIYFYLILFKKFFYNLNEFRREKYTNHYQSLGIKFHWTLHRRPIHLHKISCTEKKNKSTKHLIDPVFQFNNKLLQNNHFLLSPVYNVKCFSVFFI